MLHGSVDDMRVVFLVEDSLPNGRVGPELTPTLWSLIEEGGWHPDGGISVLASSTYPNHASFATGTDVAAHRIFTNEVWNGESFVCSSTIGPVGDTIFDAARRAGISTSATLGDRTMIGVMGARRADISWPPDGALPNGTPLDCLGYAANEAVLEVLGATDALDVDLSYVHFNDPDSTLHVFGPGAPETTTRIRQIDDDLASVVEMLRPRWDETVLFVVSDHEQEEVDDTAEPIDLAALLDQAGLPGQSHNEGTVGIVYEGPGASEVARLDDIAGATDLDDGVTLAWSDPGRVFGTRPTDFRGQHGSPRTRSQVATVSGGHPRVPELGRLLAGAQPYATDWAPLVASLFTFSLGDEHR